MDLRQLRYFATLAEELHFGRAAERLHMTQPPLSQAILALEAEIGVSLFHRTKRSVRLTPIGAQWLVHVHRLLDDAAALPGIVRRLSRGEAGALSLTFVSTADYSVLPKLLNDYKARFPGIEVTLQEATSDLQIEYLLKGEVDVGLVIAPPQETLHVSLTYLPVLREPLIAAVPESWLAEGRLEIAGDRLRLLSLLEAPLVLFPRRSAPAFHDLITGVYASHGRSPLIAQEAIQMQTIIALVSAGMGIALVPKSLENLARAGVRYLAFEGNAPEIETGLVWRNADPPPALLNFIGAAANMS